MGLWRRGRGGRRWSYLTYEQERDLLRSLEARAEKGDVLSAKQILPLACEAAGRELSLGYVYGLLHRRRAFSGPAAAEVARAGPPAVSNA